jgi:hypothetical protein
MVFFGKGLVVWTLRISLTCILFCVLLDISINVLPKATTVADGVLLIVVAVLILAMSCTIAYGLSEMFEMIVPLFVSATLFVLLAAGALLLCPDIEQAYMIGIELITCAIGLIVGYFF